MTGVGRDWKSHSNIEHICVVVHETICVTLGNRIRASKVVWSVLFSEWIAANRVLIIVLEKAPTPNISEVNGELPAYLSQK